MASIEQRKHPRRDVLEAVMVTPNGDRHDAVVMDMSLGGARMRLPEDWAPQMGAALRVFFLFETSDAVALEGRVSRVAIDHMGVQFEPEQEQRIRALLDVVSRH